MSDIEKFSLWIHDIVGRKPKDIALYSRAVTHGSFGEEDYQRLEFLGDRVLGLTIASELYQRYSNEPEGKLSQRLNGLVSGKFCGEIASSIGVSNHLLLGKQARDDGARQSAKVLGDVLGAVADAEDGHATTERGGEECAVERHLLRSRAAATRARPPPGGRVPFGAAMSARSVA